MTILLRGSVAVLAAVALAACASKNDGATVATATGDITPTPIAARYAAGSVEEFEQSVGHIVRFDYDQATIRNDAAATLERQADWLNTYPSALLVIGGHADERGTREYNLGLGERRANAVKEFLISRGVSTSRLTTISYGKEQPICTLSSESCWSQNRRGESVVELIDGQQAQR
jgi:peptidoglycan-associated lipoprotein